MDGNRFDALTKSLALLVLSLLLLGPLATPALAKPGGNSSAAHDCQKGGWAIHQGDNGERFANQRECLANARGGGEVHPIPSLYFVELDLDLEGRCGFELYATNFAPGTYYFEGSGTDNSSFSATLPLAEGETRLIWGGARTHLNPQAAVTLSASAFTAQGGTVLASDELVIQC
jgi:hypothetical protein